MKRRACVVVASEMTVRAFLVRQLEAMQELYDVTVVVNTTNRRLLDELGVRGTLRPLSIERPISVSSDVRAFLWLLRLLRAERFDLVHSMTPKAGLLAMLAARLAGIPVRVHTFTGQVWATRSGLSRAVFKAIDRVVAGCATLALADSRSQREFLIREEIVRPSKLMVLGNGSVSGVDAARFRPDPALRQRWRERLGIPAADSVMLFVGRLHRDKGVLDLARAFGLVAGERPDVRLLIVGPDEQHLRPAIEGICGSHRGRLHFLDFTSAPEAVMAASDVLCLPSYREGFGSVIIEAAAAGVPAVASRIYGIVDAIEEGRTGLLHEPGDVDGLAARLLRIVADPALRTSLGNAARVRAVRDFSQRSLTSAILDVYAQLLDPVTSSGGAGTPGRACPSAPPLVSDPDGCAR
jgi:glycosyltransferase involved in cell wall biosynthesis